MPGGKTSSTVNSRPSFSPAEAGRIADRYFGLSGEVASLPGERDQNFYLKDNSGKEFVLKIANLQEKKENLEFQNRLLNHLAQNANRVLCPRPVPALSGELIITVKNKGDRPYFVRLLTWLPGKTMAETKPHSPELLEDFGRFLGKLSNSLQSFTGKFDQPDLIWNLNKAQKTISELKYHLKSKKQKALLEKHFFLIESRSVSSLSNLPQSLIYNDANDHNVIISFPSRQLETFGQMEIKGIVDFGDIIFSTTVGDLAVGCAYAMLNKSYPLSAAARIISGYNQEKPLSEEELAALYPLIVTRLCLSVCISAFQKEERPGDNYLIVSEKPIWELLEKLASIPPELTHYIFRQACGLEPCPGSEKLAAWLEQHHQEFVFPLALDKGKEKAVEIDLSAGSLLLENPDVLSSLKYFDDVIFREVKKRGARVGIGGYGEARLCYTSSLFRSPEDRPGEGRTVHLGTDLFIEAGTAVRAPFKGKVHSFRDNNNYKDYGPTVIMEHEFDEGEVRFFTLYGHLSRDSLEALRPGIKIEKGELVGKVGAEHENGGWPPHLHFQVIVDLLGYQGDFPGVARSDEKEIWFSLSPDPRAVLEQAKVKKDDKKELEPREILELRAQHLSFALSLSYRKPLKIVRGYKQFLYDHNGRIYLDSVNNVPHVGHSRPEVVEAVRKQMAVLNTNTRYMHDNIVYYAQRLTRLLPEPLDVCFIVNSGSEANDLALRLARSFTGAKDITVVEGAYHGHISSLIDVSPYKFNGPGGKGKPTHTHVVPLPDMYRSPYSEDKAADVFAAEFKEVLSRVLGSGRRVAAFLVESLMSCAGQIVFPPGYLKKAFSLIREAGGVSIADEVQVGFGRVGTHFWGFQTQDVVPDIVTMGKPIGNGFPLAAVVTTRKIASAFEGGMEYFNTYGGNPVACAAGLAVLDVMEKESLQLKALEVGEYFENGLQRLKKEFALIGDIRGSGLFLGIEFVMDRETKEPAPLQVSYIVERMREEGVLASTDGIFRNVIKIKPPLVFGKKDVDFYLETLERVISEDPVRS